MLSSVGCIDMTKTEKTRKAAKRRYRRGDDLQAAYAFQVQKAHHRESDARKKPKKR